MARLMCGHEIVPPVRPASTKGEVVLVLDGVSTSGHAGTPLKRASLAVRGGEIVGIAGVSGNGQKALAGVISGTLAPSEGSITVRGQHVTRFTPNAMMALGVGRIPEDRMTEGLVTALPLADSMVLPRIGDPAFSRGGLLRPGAILDFAERADPRLRHSLPRADGAGRLAVRRQSAEGAAGARARLRPGRRDRRAADARPRHRRHRLRPREIPGLRANGCGLVVISEDLDELLTLSDRIAVMYEGAHLRRARRRRRHRPAHRPADERRQGGGVMKRFEPLAFIPGNSAPSPSRRSAGSRLATSPPLREGRGRAARPATRAPFLSPHEVGERWRGEAATERGRKAVESHGGRSNTRSSKPPCIGSSPAPSPPAG